VGRLPAPCGIPVTTLAHASPFVATTIAAKTKARMRTIITPWTFSSVW
jgi:hypothetical protein